MTVTARDRQTLAVLIATRDGTNGEPLPRSWKPVCDRLVRAGKLRITSAAMIFRIGREGHEEIERLEQLGVEPAPLIPGVKQAHFGARVTAGHESGDRKRGRAGGQRG